MSQQFFFSRFPFKSAGAEVRFCVEGNMVAAADEHEMKMPVNAASLGDLSNLPFCADCMGTLASAELVHGAGALKCMQCGSVYLVAAEG